MTIPPLAREPPYGRGYYHPLTGEIVPSVTTIIKVLDKPALQGWGARIAAEYAVRHWDELSQMDPTARIAPIKEAHLVKSGAARDLGTLVHDICDKWQKGLP